MKINVELGKMGEDRSGSLYKRVKIHVQVLLGLFMLICTVQFSLAATDPSDGNDYLPSYFPLK